MRPTLFVLILIPLAGCSTFAGNWKKHLPWSPEARLKDSEYQTPKRMVAIWTPDILTQPGKPPTRGFGGRFYFYNEKSQAIPVEGQLVVFAYDDSQPKHPDGNPDRKYAFTPEQFKTHFSTSDLGASYSVWIPWDPVGGEQKNISLVPIFTATSGQIVMGQQALNVLPGRERAAESPSGELTEVSQVRPASGVQPVAHLEAPQPVGPASTPAPRMRTSTITVPRSLQLRLMQDGPLKHELEEPSAAEPGAQSWGVVRTWSHTVREPGETTAGSQPQALPPTRTTVHGTEASRATPPAAPGPHQRSAHSAPGKYPAPGVPVGPVTAAVGPLPRSPAARPSVPPHGSSPTAMNRIPAASGSVPGNAW